jgi:hypothetical protein
MSSGKTLFMTKLLNEDYLAGRSIFSNYNLNFPHTLFDKQMIIDYAEQKKDLFDVSIGWDELYLQIDSRLSMSKNSLIYGYFILQTSKRNIRLYYSAQNFHTVDKRIRDNTHVMIKLSPVLIKDGQIKEYHNSERKLPPDKLKYFHIMADYYYLFANRKGKRQIIKPDRYFDLYNTAEIVKFSDNMKDKKKE